MIPFNRPRGVRVLYDASGRETEEEIQKRRFFAGAYLCAASKSNLTRTHARTFRFSLSAGRSSETARLSLSARSRGVRDALEV